MLVPPPGASPVSLPNRVRVIPSRAARRFIIPTNLSSFARQPVCQSDGDGDVVGGDYRGRLDRRLDTDRAAGSKAQA